MDPKELFRAVTSQCVWCQEQWPVVATGGHMLHVGPFTQDKNLFSILCKAETIRAAFEYIGYKGGKVKEWKPRSAAALKKVVEEYYAGNAKGKGLGMNLDSPKNRSFWRAGIRATLDVAEWPKWMKSGQEDTPPERLKQCRDELKFFDECDWQTRQQCTENLSYHFILKNGNFVRPTCNGGWGCTTCWGVYETKVEEFNQLHPCDV